MTPELKRAIIRCLPEFFSLSDAEQQRYKSTLSRVDYFKVKQHVVKQLFGINIINDSMDIYLENQSEKNLSNEIKDASNFINSHLSSNLNFGEDDLSNEQNLIVNTHMQPLYGIGEDSFYLDEFLVESLLDYDSLYDWYYSSYQWNVENEKERDKDYQAWPFYGDFSLEWARMLIDGEFYHANLSMASMYIHYELEELGNDYIQKLIPHEIEDSFSEPDNNGYIQMSLTTNAYGLEKPLKQLNNKFRTKLDETESRLQKEFDTMSLQEVLILDERDEDSPGKHFIFSDKEVLKKVNFKTFIKDCRKHEQKDASSFYIKLEREKQNLTDYLKEQYEDIIQ
jgi:hypothetical protein